MIIHFRNPGSPAEQWNEPVDWPDTLRIPVADELVDLPEHGQIWIKSVHWFLGDESRQNNDGRPSVQLIVRGYTP